MKCGGCDSEIPDGWVTMDIAPPTTGMPFIADCPSEHWCPVIVSWKWKDQTWRDEHDNVMNPESWMPLSTPKDEKPNHCYWSDAPTCGVNNQSKGDQS